MSVVTKNLKFVEPERMGTTLIMAMRPWALTMFEFYRRR